MPLPDITNPDIIKFLVETYDKTARLRMRWNTIHAAKLQKAAVIKKEKGNTDIDIIKAAMGVCMPMTTRDFKSGSVNRRTKVIRDGIHIPTTKDLKKGHSIIDVGLSDPKTDPRLLRPDSDLTPDPIMRPVDPKITKIIYKDLPTYGREAYLKVRGKVKQENKYYFQQTTASDYGWRLADSAFSRNAPTRGRVWRLTRDTKSRSGPQPDPPHYISIDTVTTCG